MSALRFVSCVMLTLALAGCGGAVPESQPGGPKKENAGGLFSGLLAGKQKSDAPSKAGPPLARATLAGGDVVVAGPDGYCIDPVTIDSTRLSGFALIASCHILSEGKVGSSVEPILVTVTVGPKGEVTDVPTPLELAATAGAPLLGGEVGDGFAVANLQGGGDDKLSTGDEKHWRGAFLQGGHLVGLALYAPKGSAYAGAHGGGMLRRVHERIATLSPSDAAPTARAKPAKGKKPQADTLLGRLFGR